MLDHLPFTATPVPTDPAHWRPLIDTAIAAQQNLLLTYFSAGRNLRTQRLVEPYWIEEHQGVPTYAPTVTAPVPSSPSALIALNA